jgi:hypothetical protein
MNALTVRYEKKVQKVNALTERYEKECEKVNKLMESQSTDMNERECEVVKELTMRYEASLEKEREIFRKSNGSEHHKLVILTECYEKAKLKIGSYKKKLQEALGDLDQVIIHIKHMFLI